MKDGLMNSELNVVLYILSLLASTGKNQWLSSNQISEHIQVHPARIRKIMSNIKRSGYVVTKEGIDGGYVLAKEPHQINMKELYSILSSKPLQIPKRSPYPDESLLARVDEHLELIILQCEQEMMNKLQNVYLSDLLDNENQQSRISTLMM
jgi:Rrf2 family protein